MHLLKRNAIFLHSFSLRCCVLAWFAYKNKRQQSKWIFIYQPLSLLARYFISFSFHTQLSDIISSFRFYKVRLRLVVRALDVTTGRNSHHNTTESNGVWPLIFFFWAKVSRAPSWNLFLFWPKKQTNFIPFHRHKQRFVRCSGCCWLEY